MLRLIDLREDKDLKQKQIAKLLNIDRSQYSKLELEVYKLTSDKLIILSDYYNTSVDYILGITNEIKPYLRNFSELKLLKLRKLSNLKSYDVSKILNVSQPQYSALENNRSQLTHDKLIILSNFYGTSIDYILGLTDEVKPYPKTIFGIK